MSAPIHSIVLYAGEWRSYGPVIILDAGCGMDVVIGGVRPGSVHAGSHVSDRVDQGMSIGTVSLPRSDGVPAVYYEVHQDDAAVDPQP